MMRTWMWAAACGLTLVAGFAVAAAWGEYRLSRLDRTAAAERGRADELQMRAARAEEAAGRYREKIEYLEAGLAEIGGLAEKQDEELKMLRADTDGLRRAADRARRVRSAAATADELCRKLGELGHGCRPEN
jgi:chromosome segregation ATPase